MSIRVNGPFSKYRKTHSTDIQESYLATETCKKCNKDLECEYSIDGGPSPAWRPWIETCPYCHLSPWSSYEEDAQIIKDREEYREWRKGRELPVSSVSDDTRYNCVSDGELALWWEWAFGKAIHEQIVGHGENDAKN